MIRILIVDDSEAIRAVITDMLKQAYSNPDIMLATNGLEGVSLAEGNQPDLILMDWSMPYMNGLLAAQQLRSSPLTNNIPLIAMTTEKDLQDVHDQFRQLGVALLHKPFNVEELLELFTSIESIPQPTVAPALTTKSK